MNSDNRFNFSDYKFLFFFISIFLIPYFSFVYFQDSSLSRGLFLITVIFSFFYIKLILNFKIKKNTTALLLFFFLYIFFRSIIHHFFDLESKPIKSLPLIFIFLFSIVIYNYINENKFFKIKKIFFVFFLILSFLAWLDFFYHIPFFNYDNRPSSVFPFVEPSHFSLVYGIIGIPLVVNSSLKLKLFILLNFYFFSFNFPSLTLTVFSLLGLMLIFIKGKLNIAKLLTITIILFIFYNIYKTLPNLEYFKNRIDFNNEEIFNWSKMVYLQGWEFMKVNLLSTKFMGLGYQMMGSSLTATGDITEIIYGVKGEFGKNIAEGSFIMSKLISEFGIIGILITLFYLSFIFNFFLNFNKKLKKIEFELDQDKRELFKKDLFCSLIIISYLVNFFIRGINYFTPQAILLIAAIIFITKNKEKIKKYIKNEN